MEEIRWCLSLHVEQLNSPYVYANKSRQTQQCEQRYEKEAQCCDVEHLSRLKPKKQLYKRRLEIHQKSQPTGRGDEKKKKTNLGVNVEEEVTQEVSGRMRDL